MITNVAGKQADPSRKPTDTQDAPHASPDASAIFSVRQDASYEHDFSEENVARVLLDDERCCKHEAPQHPARLGHQDCHAVNALFYVCKEPLCVICCLMSHHLFPDAGIDLQSHHTSSDSGHTPVHTGALVVPAMSQQQDKLPIQDQHLDSTPPKCGFLTACAAR